MRPQNDLEINFWSSFLSNSKGKKIQFTRQRITTETKSHFITSLCYTICLLPASCPPIILHCQVLEGDLSSFRLIEEKEKCTVRSRHGWHWQRSPVVLWPHVSAHQHFSFQSTLFFSSSSSVQWLDFTVRVADALMWLNQLAVSSDSVSFTKHDTAAAVEHDFPNVTS